jgi:predicted dehydrogenase
VVAVCDVARQRYTAGVEKHAAMTGRSPAGHQDFREVLDRQDVDAIFVATPDHWHALLAILGCKAGKDVYVEKPVCITVEEGRSMVRAARRYGRVVQAGTQQRSMPVFQRAIDVVRSGAIGDVTTATAWVGANGWGVGETPEPVPRGLDWDLWLGPSPYVPYSPQRYGGHMGWHDYARGGQLTNWGIHLMDIVHWGIGQDRPLTIQATGGSYRGNAGAENYETIEATLKYPRCTVTWEQRHAGTHAGKSYGVAFHGTQGTVFVDRGTVVVEPAGLGIAEFIGEPERTWANTDHHNNFFECVRTRATPAADIEQGFRSTTAVLLAGIALKTGRTLHWDGEAERFIKDPGADRHLTRAYRAPWHL